MRPLKRGDTGKDVVAVQLALRHYFKQHGLGNGPGRTGAFGANTSNALATFQRRRSIKADRHGHYGRTTHAQLSAHMGPTALAKLIEEKTKRDTQGPAGMRARIVATAMFGYNHARYSMQYTQGGPRDDWLWQKIRPPRTPKYADCSSFAEWCYWVAGAPHPSGWGYRSIGWTGSQIQHGQRVNSGTAQPGDLVFYPGGSGAIGHVTVKVSTSMCVSFGSEPIRHLSVWYRPVAFAINYLGRN